MIDLDRMSHDKVADFKRYPLCYLSVPKSLELLSLVDKLFSDEGLSREQKDELLKKKNHVEMSISTQELFEYLNGCSFKCLNQLVALSKLKTLGLVRYIVCIGGPAAKERIELVILNFVQMNYERIVGLVKFPLGHLSVPKMLELLARISQLLSDRGLPQEQKGKLIATRDHIEKRIRSKDLFDLCKGCSFTCLGQLDVLSMSKKLRLIQQAHSSVTLPEQEKIESLIDLDRMSYEEVVGLEMYPLYYLSCLKRFTLLAHISELRWMEGAHS